MVGVIRQRGRYRVAPDDGEAAPGKDALGGTGDRVSGEFGPGRALLGNDAGPDGVI